MLKFVFFDLDETLIDIKKSQNESIKSLFERYGFNKKANLNDFIAKWDDLTEYHYKFYTAKQISYEEQRKRRVIDLFKSYNIDLEEDPMDVYDIYLREFENSWNVFDDVVESLETLKNNGYKLGVISNGDYYQQIQKMKKVGIHELFTFVSTSSQLQYSKPDPRTFETVFETYGIDFDQVVYVGDSYKKDILPCREIGVKAILIDRKNLEYDDDRLIKIVTLKEIIDVLK